MVILRDITGPFHAEQMVLLGAMRKRGCAAPTNRLFPDWKQTAGAAMRLVILVISGVALTLAALLAALGPAHKYGALDLMAAFGLMRQLTVPTLFAAGLAMLGFLLSLFKARDLAPLALIAALAAGTAGYMPVQMKQMADANPFIHDITTDFDNPPAIAAAASLPRSNPPGYVGAEKVRGTEKTVADAQRESFADIQPLIVEAPVADAATAARKVLAEMKMPILAEPPASPEGVVTIEAVFTSLWFGFKDDFIVRLTPEGAGTRIDVRSKSRVGGSDLGANAARVRKFLRAMDAAI
jgi:uncharacterized protein (DUF1499 family)